MLSNLILNNMRFNFATHTIVKGMYLVPKKPTPPQTAYTKYTQEKLKGKTGKISEAMKAVAADWK